MIIRTPSNDRMDLIRAVLEDNVDPDLLTDHEMAWLENHMMEKFIVKMSETNVMVFGSCDQDSIH